MLLTQDSLWVSVLSERSARAHSLVLHAPNDSLIPSSFAGSFSCPTRERDHSLVSSSYIGSFSCPVRAHSGVPRAGGHSLVPSSHAGPEGPSPLGDVPPYHGLCVRRAVAPVNLESSSFAQIPSLFCSHSCQCPPSPMNRTLIKRRTKASGFVRRGIRACNKAKGRGRHEQATVQSSCQRGPACRGGGGSDGKVDMERRVQL